MDGRIRVAVIATGLDAAAGKALRPRRTSSCRFRKHQAQPSAIYNQGFYFSTCRNCGEDMIRTGSEWQVVPKGLRVVWPGSAPASRPAPADKPARRRGGGKRLYLRFAPFSLAAAGLRCLFWRGGDAVRVIRARWTTRGGRSGLLLLPGAASH